jgi:LacI family transcriptional regulator
MPGRAGDPARPTMADVAARAGVSKMTVSRVVNGYPGVSSEVSRRVGRAIRQLSYVPSQRARSLAVGRTQLLGMIVLDVVSEWVWPLIRGAGREAERLGYQVLLRTTGAGRVADLPDPQLDSDLLDGLIIVSWRVPLAFSRQLARRGYPVVLIDAFERPSEIAWVSSQDREGARQATRHLTGLGHRRIAFISGGAEPYLAQERLAGFQQGLQEAGLRLTDVVHGDFSRPSGYRLARRLLRRKRPPTAIFAANDLMAIGALDAAGELGVAVPAQLSVVGFDDISSAGHIRPALTTVARPYEEMGARAVQQMVEAVHAPPRARPVRQLDLPTHLVVRESTAAPAQP